MDQITEITSTMDFSIANPKKQGGLGKGKTYDVPILTFENEDQAVVELKKPFAGTSWMRFNSNNNVTFYK
jgi:hypothetical protein